MSQANAQTSSRLTLPSCVQAWKDAVEGGSTPQEIAENCYHQQAVLKGTVSSEAVRGTEKITDYFIHFTAGKNNIVVDFDTLARTPSGSVCGKYTFNWTDDDGNDQSAAANYTFEPVINDDKTEVISLHHSSFQPD